MGIIGITEIIKTTGNITLSQVTGKIQRVVNAHTSSITVSCTGSAASETIEPGMFSDFCFDGDAWMINSDSIQLLPAGGAEGQMLSKVSGDNYNVQWSTPPGSSALMPEAGLTMNMLYKYRPISPTFPWFCMSLPDQNWTTANYSSAFIDEMRSRKVIYDELDTNISSFSGSWAGGVFTLDNNTANNAMIAELNEEYLFAGSPATNWRLLNDGAYDFNITAISVSARTITVSTADHTPSGTSISIYLHRVYGSATSARHFSWAGLGLYMCGGGKVSGLRRRDAMQQIKGSLTAYPVDFAFFTSASGAISVTNSCNLRTSGSTSATTYKTANFDSEGSPGARTASKTRIESGTVLIYLYVGSYTV